jgi:multidrug efflux pump
MKRFNLSAWAVAHPALVLFLIVALGVAGFVSYQDWDAPRTRSSRSRS